MHHWGARLIGATNPISCPSRSQSIRAKRRLLAPEDCVSGDPGCSHDCRADAVAGFPGQKLDLFEFIRNFILYVCQKYLYTSDI